MPDAMSYRTGEDVLAANEDFATWLTWQAGLVRRGDYAGIVAGSLVLVADTGMTMVRSMHAIEPS